MIKLAFRQLRKISFASDTSGATLAEYGMALIVAIVVGATAVSSLATAVSDELEATASAF